MEHCSSCVSDKQIEETLLRVQQQSNAEGLIGAFKRQEWVTQTIAALGVQCDHMKLRVNNVLRSTEGLDPLPVGLPDYCRSTVSILSVSSSDFSGSGVSLLV